MLVSHLSNLAEGRVARGVCSVQGMKMSKQMSCDASTVRGSPTAENKPLSIPPLLGFFGFENFLQIKSKQNSWRIEEQTGKQRQEGTRRKRDDKTPEVSEARRLKDGGRGTSRRW